MDYRLSIKFYLHESKQRSDGKFPLYLRVTVDRDKVEMALNNYLTVNEWDEAKQRSKKDMTLNDRLAEYESKIYLAARNIQSDGYKVDARTIKDVLTGKSNSDHYLIQYFEDHIAFTKRNPEIQAATISRYQDTLDHLRQFIKKEKRANEYQLKRADVKFIRDFEMYLLNFVIPVTGKTLERNTVNKHLTRLKTIFLKAISEGAITVNPFSSLKIRYTPSKREFLTDSELEALNNLDFTTNPTLDRVRDIFMWQCYTGLRFEDAQQLTMQHVKQLSNGDYELVITQEKTNQPLTIPLFPQAINIYHKYDKHRAATGNILPQISNQKANHYLKYMGTLAGIEKNLTTHVARHTCATTVLLQHQVPIEAVSKWLGHTQIRTTQIYGKITNEYLRDIANKISNKL